MKTIGLIGGLTWHSTVDYYRNLNELVAAKLGGANSAKILMYSVNFDEIKKLTLQLDWAGIANLIGDVAVRLQNAGADCILLGANTMHKIANEVQQQINIPLIHIAETTAHEINKNSIKKVALLGTKYTMELGFYQEKLLKFGIETIIPNDADRALINSSIYDEMSVGQFLPNTKAAYLAIIAKMKQQGAEGIILGCTEIPILLKHELTEIPFFDTGFLHAEAAVAFALG
jgi:aspartate racemase